MNICREFFSNWKSYGFIKGLEETAQTIKCPYNNSRIGAGIAKLGLKRVLKPYLKTNDSNVTTNAIATRNNSAAKLFPEEVKTALQETINKNPDLAQPEAIFHSGFKALLPQEGLF